ncbi:glycosyltransferase family 4 protein [Ruegeria arenilitoris]|uniref:glycosyltransferase family 4 protein n=1 Tax=Ruegeria arenilitoris TaxID=1173585 RepID=UPI00147B9F7A|nr:glycosyltransferase family 4 protein [Ruegeria arenilitoris]
MPTKVVNISFSNQNPYQRMMYSACRPEYELVPARNEDILRFAEPEFQAEHKIAHLHWDDRLFRASRKRGESQHTVFLNGRDSLIRFKDAGGRIIWTIHNRHAHAKGAQSDNFGDYRLQLAELADLIHVHTPNAEQHMIEEYGVDPDKIRLIPHPSYLGVYEPSDRTLNRRMAPRDVTRFLTFGAMRGNREIDRVEHATKKLTTRGYAFHFSVVGRVFSGGRRIARRMQANPNVSVVPERIMDSDIPQVFSTAHVYVLPSTTTFTSGTAMLAQAFGLPIIAPDIESHRQTTPEACHDLLYSTENPRALIRMMQHVMKLPDEELAKKRKACFDFAIEREPAHLSKELKSALSEFL